MVLIQVGTVSASTAIRPAPPAAQAPMPALMGVKGVLDALSDRQSKQIVGRRQRSGDPRQWPIVILASSPRSRHDPSGNRRVMWTPITASSAMAMPPGTVSVAMPYAAISAAG
jgi:hypothetical protein